MENHKDNCKSGGERGPWGAHGLGSSHQAMDVLPEYFVPSGVVPPLPPQSLTHQGETSHLLGAVVLDISGWDPSRPGQVPWKDTNPFPIMRRGSVPFHVLSKGSYHHTRMGGVSPGVCQWMEGVGSLCKYQIHLK